MAGNPYKSPNDVIYLQPGILLKRRSSRPGYLTRVLVTISQMFNVVLFDGMPDEMFSARAYRNETFNGSATWGYVRRLLDACFFWQVDHCRQTYEWELGRRDDPEAYH